MKGDSGGSPDLEKIGKQNLDQYHEKGFLKGGEDEELLRDFFRSHCVVAGLTREEVQVCVYLSREQKKWREKQTALTPIFLPRELIRFPELDIPRTTPLQRSIFEILQEFTGA